MKSYHQYCGVARALDRVGERWTLLLIRDLLIGPRRYSELQRALGGISPGILSQRLETLTEDGLVVRQSDHRYALTQLGAELEATVLALGAFGARYLNGPQPDDRLDPRWAMVSLKRRYRGSRSAGSVLFAVGPDAYWTSFRDSVFQVKEHTDEWSDARIEGEAKAWFTLLNRIRSLNEMLAEDRIVITGKRRVARALLRAIGV
ncbi:MAG: helix-turn-helix domain-containing protein [Myxococcota bacterium]